MCNTTTNPQQFATSVRGVISGIAWVKESFRQWSWHLATVLDRIRPGARTLLNGIERSYAEEWNQIVHDLEFVGEGQDELKNMYGILNQDMLRLTVCKTT